MDQRLQFVAAFQRGETGMTGLCAAFGISRETGYKWLARYREHGLAGLADRSRAPHHPAHALAPELAETILALRQERPHWGPKKLKAVLARRAPEQAWPAASTIGDLLKRRGLILPRSRRRRAVLERTQAHREAEAPNERWCIDFKGWFRTRDGCRCDPLTLTDDATRYLLLVEILEPTTSAVAAAVERLLREQGLPERLLMDNGSPFASCGVAGLSRLSVKWLKLGIGLERITPGCPQENGRHERMHRTLKAETSRPPAASPPEQQARFDRFRHLFNHERPHEALAQVPPGSRYQPSPRPYPNRVEEPWYDAEHEVRRVRSDGGIKWRGEQVFISEALAGEPIGLATTERGDWLVRFAGVDLALIDRRTLEVTRCTAARPGRRAAEPSGTGVSHVPGPNRQP